jgi:hypothetical protein
LTATAGVSVAWFSVVIVDMIVCLSCLKLGTAVGFGCRGGSALLTQFYTPAVCSTATAACFSW